MTNCSSLPRNCVSWIFLHKSYTWRDIVSNAGKKLARPVPPSLHRIRVHCHSSFDFPKQNSIPYLEIKARKIMVFSRCSSSLSLFSFLFVVVFSTFASNFGHSLREFSIPRGWQIPFLPRKGCFGLPPRVRSFSFSFVDPILRRWFFQAFTISS